MFVKTEMSWINLKMCERITIEQTDVWWIKFHYPSVDANTQCNYSIGRFKNKYEAEEVLDEIWDAYKEDKPYYEPDPRTPFNVKINDKWYSHESSRDAIYTYAKAIEVLGLEEIEKQGIWFVDESVENDKGRPIVMRNADRKIAQMQSECGKYYILCLDTRTSMKKVLEQIANELGKDIEVTIYHA